MKIICEITIADIFQSRNNHDYLYVEEVNYLQRRLVTDGYSPWIGLEDVVDSKREDLQMYLRRIEITKGKKLKYHD